MTVERGDECIWIGKRRIVYFASRTRRLEKEVNFSSSCSADYQHWTYLSPVSLPRFFFSLDIIRSSTTTIRSELNTRRIWSSYLGSSRLLLILTRIEITTLTTERITQFICLIFYQSIGLFQCLWYVLIS